MELKQIAITAFHLSDTCRGINTGGIEAPRDILEVKEKDNKVYIVWKNPETCGLSDCRYHNLDIEPHTDIYETDGKILIVNNTPYDLEYCRQFCPKETEDLIKKLENMEETLITDKVVTSPIEMINTVLEDYRRHDDELSSLHFCFNVKMARSKILNAYSEIQHLVNGDSVVRIGKKGEELPLVSEYDDTIYEGNCRTFLESYNNNPKYLRITDEDEIVEFIFA